MSISSIQIQTSPWRKTQDETRWSHTQRNICRSRWPVINVIVRSPLWRGRHRRSQWRSSPLSSWRCPGPSGASSAPECWQWHESSVETNNTALSLVCVSYNSHRYRSKTSHPHVYKMISSVEYIYMSWYYFKRQCIYRDATSGNLSSSFPAYLDRHDNTTGHIFHLFHHPIRSPPELGNKLQVICLHHKVLDGGDKHFIHVLIQLRKCFNKKGWGAFPDDFTWSPIVTQAFESRSRGGL